jgi:hypothetical protein
MRMTKLLALSAAAFVSSVGASFAQTSGSPLLYGAGFNTLSQAAVFSGGIAAEGPMIGGNLFGVTKLPFGTQLVTGLPVGERAIILPGMVGVPSFAPGCNVVTVGNSEPSALGLIGTTPVAETPAANPRTITTTVKKTTVTRRFARLIPHHECHRVVKRHCAQAILK